MWQGIFDDINLWPIAIWIGKHFLILVYYMIVITVFVKIVMLVGGFILAILSPFLTILFFGYYFFALFLKALGFRPYMPEVMRHLDDPPPIRLQPENHGENDSHTAEPKPEPCKDPFDVLGVPRTATKDDVIRAYREKMKLNHPDRAADLDREIQQFATERAKEINSAYQEILQNLA